MLLASSRRVNEFFSIFRFAAPAAIARGAERIESRHFFGFDSSLISIGLPSPVTLNESFV